MHNVLTDQIIQITLPDQSVINANLPEVFVLALEDRIAEFPALRPHQRHPWHASLCQLGALAVLGTRQNEFE